MAWHTYHGCHDCLGMIFESREDDLAIPIYMVPNYAIMHAYGDSHASPFTNAMIEHVLGG